MRKIARLPSIVVLALALALPAGLACQGTPAPRLALVIGNSEYSGMPRLANPRNDAQDVAAALEGLGFEVTLLIDANRRAMNQAIIAFREALAEDRRTEGLFYFAGHGVQARGVNYLVPVGSDIRSEVDLEDEAISAQKVLASLEEARNRVNLVVLDACRDNPLPASARSSSRGLAVVGSAPPETLIVYSTAAGQTAADGEGRNSPFAAAFVAHLADPGDITSTVKRVTGDVKAATGGAQTPYVYMGLSLDFALNPSGGAAAAAGAALAAAPAPTPAAPAMRLTKSYGSVLVTAASSGKLFVDGVEVGPISAGSEARLDRVESGQRAFELRNERGGMEKATVLVSAGATARAVFTSVARALRSDAFVTVEGGEFTMGDAGGKSGDQNDKPAHKVRVDGFLMAKYEITQAEYAAVMGADGHYRQMRKPAYTEYAIGWFDAVEFCNRISVEDGLDPCYSIPGSGTDPALWPAGWKETLPDQIACDWGASGYRLPTEAEWEYAARGGRLSKGYAFAGSNDAKLVSGVFTSVSDYTPGKKPPNELGLYDMSNLSFEWCWDRYDSGYYAVSPADNPRGPDSYMAKPPAAAESDGDEGGKAGSKAAAKPLSGPLRVVRGGLYGPYGRGKEVWFRYASTPVYNYWTKSNLTGIRLVRSLPR